MLNAECRVMRIESRFCCDRQRKFFATHPATMKAASEIGAGWRDRERAFWICSAEMMHAPSQRVGIKRNGEAGPNSLGSWNCTVSHAAPKT